MGTNGSCNERASGAYRDKPNSHVSFAMCNDAEYKKRILRVLKHVNENQGYR